jgi:hypothetical protein
MAGSNVRASWLRAGKVAGLVLAAALAGCSDDTTSPVAPDPGTAPRPETPNGPQAHDTGITPVVRRVELDFDVNGAFRPGVPITVTAVARGRREANEVNLELAVLDERGAAESGWRQVGSDRTALGRGAEHRMTRTLVFPEPGYYRVSARAFSSGPTPTQLAQGDSLILNSSYETLYILIDQNGGRLTDGFDPAVAGPGRLPMFGSFGPFVTARTRGSGGARTNAAPTGGALRQTTTSFRYYLDYDNQDTGTRRPVAGAEAEIKCLDASFNVVSTNYYTTAADGSFAFTCSSGYFDGSVRLRDIYSEVMSPGQVIAGVSYFNEGTVNNTRLVAANQYAAHVFVTLRQYVPTAEARFGNRWRPRLPVLVHATDATFPIHYDQTQDTMRTNHSRVFNEDGRFVTMHEYGHSYHYRAIERWNSYYCSPGGTHHTHLPYTLSCAFVEGFATFFAVWVAGNELTTGYHTDNGIETQTFYTNGDGVIIEGSVAGFLYDLVDGSAQRDNTANSAAFEETWDTAVYPGSFIADIMANCAPYTGTATSPTYTYYLDGADQLVYCMEGNVSAETQTANWRTTWSGVTRSPNFASPTGYSTSVVRTLWRRNFYGLT